MVQLFAGKNYIFESSSSLTGGRYSTAYLSLIDNSGGYITGGETRIGFSAKISGLYYISVQGYGPNAVGDYSILGTEVTVDDYAAGTTTTGVLTVNQKTNGKIDFINDEDWLKVDLIAGKNYIFEASSSLTGGSRSTTLLSLIDNSGWYIAAGEAKIGFSAKTSGSYYISIKGYSSEAVGSYSISATEVAIAAQIPTVSLSEAKIIEGHSGTSFLVYTATLSNTSSSAVSFNVKITGGTASVGSDYAAIDQTITIAAGAKTATIDVPIVGDTNVETDETIILTLSQVSGAQLANNATSLTAVGTIQNDDLPTLTLSGGTVKEGTAGFATLSYTATLSEKATTPVSFTIKSTGGTATTGSDYAAIDRTVTIAAGSTSTTIEVPVVGDTRVEADETVILTLSQVSGAQLANNATSITATGTILNDDLPTFTLTGGSVKEGDAGRSELVFNIQLSQATTNQISFIYKTIDGTAKAGSDYVATSHAVAMISDTMSFNIKIPIIGDTNIEANESVVLVFSDFHGISLANNATSITATGTILNDDVGAAFILSAYKALNPDLVAAFGSDNAAYVRHYINSGKAEGRTSAGFDAEAYAALNPDLLNAFGLNDTALANHYRTNGLAEGRVATGFDADAYAAMNPYLFAAFGTNHEALIRHYASNGKAEGRVATGFDVDAYAALNPDLFRAFGLNASSLINHYIQNGKAEGRSADGFDVDAYAALNPDLFAAFGLDQSALINHYINSGRAEGRAAMAPLVALGLPMEPDFVA